MRLSNRKRNQRGNNILEFALVALPLVTLLLGVTTTGLGLGRSVQVAQVCRDAASMFVRGVDFSRDGNKDVLVRLSQGLGMTRDGGDGVILLSKVTWIPQQKCTDLGLVTCNGDRHVITQRIVVGNPSLRTSALGTPNAGLLDAKGIVRDYLIEASAVANFPMMTLQDGQYAYVVETHFTGFMGGAPIYSRAIF
jgi:hypothetical protein